MHIGAVHKMSTQTCKKIDPHLVRKISALLNSLVHAGTVHFIVTKSFKCFATNLWTSASEDPIHPVHNGQPP